MTILLSPNPPNIMSPPGRGRAVVWRSTSPSRSMPALLTRPRQLRLQSPCCTACRTMLQSFWFLAHPSTPSAVFPPGKKPCTFSLMQRDDHRPDRPSHKEPSSSQSSPILHHPLHKITPLLPIPFPTLLPLCRPSLLDPLKKNRRA